MEFNRHDLDQVLLCDRALEEAKGIFEHPSRARGRSLDQIFNYCVQGQSAEVYLMQYHGYTSDPHKYGDVINPADEAVEIKTTDDESGVDHVVDKCNQIKLKEPWRNYPEHLYVFIYNRGTLDYYLYNKYKWNGAEYAPLNPHNVVDIIEDPEYFVLNLPKKYDSDSIAKIFMYYKDKEKPWVTSFKPLKIVDKDKTVAIINHYEDLMNDHTVSNIMRSYRPNLWLPTYAIWKRGLMKLYDERFAKCNNGTIKVEKELTYA